MRLRHGTFLSLEALRAVNAGLVGQHNVSLLPSGVVPVPLQKFDYMFLELQDNPNALLPESDKTRQDLIDLGISMMETIESVKPDSTIPSGYTYLGQFISHDITLEAVSERIPHLFRLDLRPMSLTEVRATIMNTRTGALDLDSVYAPRAKRDGDNKMALDNVTTFKPFAISQRPVPGKDLRNDLPRRDPSTDPETDREALIGDARNDENLILSQLHVAFLRAHNVLMDRGIPFDEAEKQIRQHYQHLIIHDFLEKIVEPGTVDRILSQRNRFYKVQPDDFYLPLEFSVAAYRFGHSMVRSFYNYNQNFNTGEGFQPAMLSDLFTFTAFSGSLGPILDGGDRNILQNWVIEWENFVDVGTKFNRARPIDTSIVEPLYALQDFRGVPEKGDGARLAVRNLLRGYLLRMPTGQAVAQAIGVPALTSEEILGQAESDEQKAVLLNSTFLAGTPLWYYVLAEAAVRGSGNHLGPVGSTIVAEVLIGLVRQHPDSILEDPDWTPTLGAVKGVFTLADLIWLSGNLPGWKTDAPVPISHDVIATEQ